MSSIAKLKNYSLHFVVFAWVDKVDDDSQLTVCINICVYIEENGAWWGMGGKLM